MFEVDISPGDWFNYDHQHMDWDGLGDLGPCIRAPLLQAHTIAFRAYALAFASFEQPFQLWLSIARSDAGQDAVYCHSPNPCTSFPAEFDDVTWGFSALEAFMQEWLPEYSLVAGRRDWNYILYAEGIGVPLRNQPA